MLAFLLRLATLHGLLFCFGLLCQSGAYGMTVKELPPIGVGPVIRTPQGREVHYQESHALLISASNYMGQSNQGWPPLENTAREMDDVAGVLQKHGFHVRRVSDPRSNELLPEIRQFMADHAYSPLNRVIVFFSGHGYSENGAGYLVPVDAKLPSIDPSAFRAQALPIDTLQGEAARATTAHVLFLFDSCFSGSIFFTRGPGDVPTTASSERWRYLNDMIKTPMRQFISAGDAKQELPPKSYFAALFVKALSDGSGARGADGYITSREIAQYLAEQVRKRNPGQTPQYGFVRDPDLEFGDMIFQLPGRGAGANPYPGGLDSLKVRPGQPRSVRIKVTPGPLGQDASISNNHNWVASTTVDADIDIYVYYAQTGKRASSIVLPDPPDENSVDSVFIRQLGFSPDEAYLYVLTETRRKNAVGNASEHRILLFSTGSWKVVRTLAVPIRPRYERRSPEIVSIRNKQEVVVQYRLATGWGMTYAVEHLEWTDRDNSEPVRSRILLEGANIMCQSDDYAVYSISKGQPGPNGMDYDFVELSLKTMSISHFSKDKFNVWKDNVMGLCNRKISQAVHERISDLRMRMGTNEQGLVTLSPPGTRPAGYAKDELPEVLAIDESGSASAQKKYHVSCHIWA